MGFDLLGGLESIFKMVDMPGSLIGAGCKALGLPPVIGDAVKIGVGLCCQDYLMVADGAVGALHEVQGAACAGQTSYCPSSNPSIACQGYAPSPFGNSPFPGLGFGLPSPFANPFSPQMGFPSLPFGLPPPPFGLPMPPFGFPTPPIPMPPIPAPWIGGAGPCGGGSPLPADACSEQEAVTALLNDSVCQSKPFISKHDLEHFNNDINASPALKRAARFFLDHPDTWNRVARSGPNPFTIMLEGRVASRSDLQLASEDLARGRGASVGASPGYGPTCATHPPYGSPGFPYPTWGTGGGLPQGGLPHYGGPGPLGGGYGNGALDWILNDPSMSTEEKLEAVLMQMENSNDDALLQTTEALNRANTSLGALSPSDTSDETAQKKAQIQNDQQMLNLQITKLVDRRKNLSDLMTNIEEKFNEMSKLAIQNMAR